MEGQVRLWFQMRRYKYNFVYFALSSLENIRTKNLNILVQSNRLL